LSFPSKYVEDLNDYYPVARAKSLNIAMLILQDQRDFQVTMKDCAFWKSGLEGRANVTLRSYPNLKQSLPECGDPNGECRLTWTAWLSGRSPSAARVALAQLASKARSGEVAPSALVVAYARQGNTAQALDFLDYMLKGHEVWLIILKVNPLCDPIRGNPRILSVLRTLHL
jgi:hypothetical protein